MAKLLVKNIRIAYLASIPVTSIWAGYHLFNIFSTKGSRHLEHCKSMIFGLTIRDSEFVLLSIIAGCSSPVVLTLLIADKLRGPR